MKKKILGGLLVVAIAVVAAFNMNMNTEKNEMSALMLANVEALAGSESGGGTSVSTCYTKKAGAAGYPEDGNTYRPCDSQTSENTIYPCKSFIKGIGSYDSNKFCTTK